ncbi:MAG: hypothetical protein DRO90_03305 [Candidatus Altiarchaeales archaeon]|nr:MAG: hypothetical protein DRO90_03305 [Candidatus Altiarchaeales archaeon]
MQKYEPLEEVSPVEYADFKGIYRATVHVTDRCNLRCLYCGFDSGGGERAEIPYETMANVVSTLARHQIRHLDLSGGEVTIRKDIFDILRLIDQTPMSLGIISNGTLITPEMAENLGRYQIHAVKISFDGLRDNHDKLRGEGNYDRAMNGLRNVVDRAGIKTKALMTLTAYNGQDVGELAKVLADSGAWRLVIRGCDSNGRSNADYVPTEKHIDRVYRDLLALEGQLPEEFIEWSFINPFPHLGIWANNPYVMLEESGRHMTILANGDVMVDYCSFCANGSKEGNLFEQDLDEIVSAIIQRT